MTEHEQLQQLVTRLGDRMNEFLLAKVEKIRADQRFVVAQRAVSESEDELRQFKWGEKPLEAIKKTI